MKKSIYDYPDMWFGSVDIEIQPGLRYGQDYISTALGIIITISWIRKDCVTVGGMK